LPREVGTEKVISEIGNECEKCFFDKSWYGSIVIELSYDRGRVRKGKVLLKINITKMNFWKQDALWQW
jgi:hypothetical protein